MKVIVDSLIYQFQAHGGLSRLYNEILSRMCAMDASLQVTVLTSGRLRQPVPAHPRIFHQRLFPIDALLRPGRFWWAVSLQARAFLQRRWLGDAKGWLWHSTYYTLLEPWDGPRVVTIADMIHERLPHLFQGAGHERFRKQKRHCIVSADALICISDTSRQDAQQVYGIDATRMHTIPLAHSSQFTRLGDVRHTLPPLVNKPFFLYIGDRQHYKNFTGFLHAYSTWPGQKKVGVVVVGKNWTAQEKQMLAQLGVADRVHLYQNLDDQHLCVLYNQAAAFIYPSLYEGFGIPLLEAMACGCPVIASRIPSTMEVAGEYPFYFQLSDQEGLAHALDTTLVEGQTSERMHYGLERTKLYSWDNTARQILGVYHTLQRAL